MPALQSATWVAANAVCDAFGGPAWLPLAAEQPTSSFSAWRIAFELCNAMAANAAIGDGLSIDSTRHRRNFWQSRGPAMI
jgi:hypothetical protein